MLFPEKLKLVPQFSRLHVLFSPERFLFYYQILTLSDANISDEKGFGFIAHHQAYKEH